MAQRQQSERTVAESKQAALVRRGTTVEEATRRGMTARRLRPETRPRWRSGTTRQGYDSDLPPPPPLPRDSARLRHVGKLSVLRLGWLGALWLAREKQQRRLEALGDLK